MKKTVIFVLLIVIFTLAVLGAYKLITDKKDGEPLHAADPASGLKNQPVFAPVVTVADEPNITDISETKDPESNRDKDTQFTFYVEGTIEDFAASLFVSDFGFPEADNVYSIYIDAERFAYERVGNADIFCTESGAEMEIALHRDTTVEALLPSFTESSKDFTDIECKGVTDLESTGLNGYIVNANGAVECVRAYLIDHNGDAVTVVMSYTREMAGGYLRQMISMFDSFEFEG